MADVLGLDLTKRLDGLTFFLAVGHSMGKKSRVCLVIGAIYLGHLRWVMEKFQLTFTLGHLRQTGIAILKLVVLVAKTGRTLTVEGLLFLIYLKVIAIFLKALSMVYGKLIQIPSTICES